MTARNPVACPDKGHIFCKECIVENLLSQRNEIKQMNLEIAQKHEQELKLQAEEEERALQREIKDFELLQYGLGGSDKNVVPELVTRTRTTVESGNSKRKLELDPDELDRISKESKDKIKKILREEERESSKAKLPAFWVPSLTPSVDKKTPEAPKLDPLCPVSDPDDPHTLSLKSLLAVHFDGRSGSRPNSTSSQRDARACPSCERAFGSVLDAYLTKPCGHVICKACYEKVMKPKYSGEKLICYVCEENLSEQPARSKHSKKDTGRGRGIIFLAREGTGFAGGGNSVVEKAGVAFQA
ncbi:uncharacterized protein V1513DRAFT_439866 [Lipomyces chichibuensis]|uniref:uncharacterized protein n=1 Tax=Lipomyces chichibuensis TaxID=1546026 RepID=UPI003344260D